MVFMLNSSNNFFQLKMYRRRKKFQAVASISILEGIKHLVTFNFHIAVHNIHDMSMVAVKKPCFSVLENGKKRTKQTYLFD